MPKHRADCTDCPWSYRDEDLVDVSDEMERHARKEHHHVDLQRAVATDGGEDVDGTERESRVIFETEYLRVLRHRDGDVAVAVGDPPEASAPTIVDASELRDALDAHLLEEDSPRSLTLVDSGSGHQLLRSDVVQWIDPETVAVENVLTNPHTDILSGESDAE